MGLRASWLPSFQAIINLEINAVIFFHSAKKFNQLTTRRIVMEKQKLQKSALGMVETVGLVASIEAADAMTKVANVSIAC